MYHYILDPLQNIVHLMKKAPNLAHTSEFKTSPTASISWYSDYWDKLRRLHRTWRLLHTGAITIMTLSCWGTGERPFQTVWRNKYEAHHFICLFSRYKHISSCRGTLMYHDDLECYSMYMMLMPTYLPPTQKNKSGGHHIFLYINT